jgi:hypothetical protein
MAYAELVAAAIISGSPTVQALVLGHLAAGRPGMAILALHLPGELVKQIDRAFAEALGGSDGDQ